MGGGLGRQFCLPDSQHTGERSPGQLPLSRAFCGAVIVDIAGLGECSVAHVWNTAKAPSIAIPFCRRCAVSEEAVSRLTKAAVEKATGVPSARLQ